MSSIRVKMLLWFGLALLVLLSALGLVTYHQTKATVVPLTEELSQEVLRARSAEMARLMQGYINDIKTMSRRNLIRSGNFNEIKTDLSRRAHLINADYEMLFYADARGRYVTTTGAEGDVSDREYFKAVMLEGREQFVSEPIVSRASGGTVFVVACAVIDQQDEKIGLIAATVLLKTLSEIAGSIKIGDSGIGWVVDHKGLLIAHPDESLRMHLNLLKSLEKGYDGLERIGRKMTAGESGVLSFRRPDGSKLMTVFGPIANTPDWSLGISLHEEELMGKAIRLMRVIAFLMVAILIAVLLVVFFISGRITSPLLALKKGVQIVSSGNLNHSLDIRTGDEIEELAHSFNKMTGDLKEHIRHLQQVTAEMERVEGELRVANRIQASMLPRTFPPYPDIESLDLYATMEPAREVGGDFYDFFLVDDHRFCFSIGDVSGKGVSAALFMVITRTILKNQALQGNSLTEIFYQTNNMLCTENVEDMFVTVFMGMLDTRTGEIEYVCAGHNPPLISRNGDNFVYLDVPRNLVLGGLEDYRYQPVQTVIRPGDTLFLYTDGITEAMNREGELFTDTRMFTAVNSLKLQDVRAIIQGARKEIDRFVQDTPASDDVTMMALTLNKQSPDI